MSKNKKFNVDIRWEERHGGTVEIMAESEEEAKNKAQVNFYDYQNEVIEQGSTYNEEMHSEILGVKKVKGVK